MDSFVQLATDQAGKEVQQFENVIGSNTVEAMGISPIDSTGWSDSFVEVSESIGKKIQYFQNTIGANAVHAQALVWVDTSGSPV